MITRIPTEVAPARRADLAKQVAIIWGGINDDANGLGAGWAEISARLQQCRADCLTAGYSAAMVCTEIDALGSGSRWHTDYLLLNADLRAHIPTIDLIDLGARPELQDATNTTYYSGDKVHLIAAGYAVVRDTAAPKIAARLVL